ncbi:Gfo/Idh/MocA family oxidoreductase [Halostagnicola sp. A-GB9-2]|uniref:Gfo/Idh/MocA family protein n=1 Tax=Halostagnicola sp. A-GB9-2 TaxID=3048066 RepID=UPI0024C0C98D|nr:Gfo/Idh/MocA family oxidoreductase [Halostagnicola sp. A-GB9-2]MDJ1433620.1 Gfo/Idh/MocA family oxidoreductase [Halostagnicola sp. A-GB9-2]
MAKHLRTGIIGTGDWGTHVAKQFHEHPDAAVTAITDITMANRTRAGETLEVDSDHQYGHHEAMLDNEGLDAVQISSPHELHYDHTIAALERDVHVFCEKPFTPGLERARDLARRAETDEQILMVGYQRHVNPAYVAIREAISSGDVEPKVVTAELTQDWIQDVSDTWRANTELSGGGQLYDSGSHLLDAIIWMLEDVPTHVSAEMEFYEDTQIDIQAALAVRFAGGTVANITVSGDSPDVSERIVVRGDGGRCLLEGTGWTDREVTITDSAGDLRKSIESELSSYEKVDAFVRSVRSGTEPPATAENALYATALTEAAYKSERLGQRVPIETK